MPAIPAYVINLSDHTDRLDWMKAQFERQSISFTRINALDLRGAAGKAHLAEIAHLPRAKLRPAEIGCLTSHKMAWERIVQSGQPWGAVFEDDVLPGPSLGKALADDAWLKDAPGLIRLETRPGLINVAPQPLARMDDILLVETIDNSMGGAGYLLSAARAAELIADFDSMSRPSDIELWAPQLVSIVPAVVPGLCIQTRFLPNPANAQQFDTVVGEARAMPAQYAASLRRLPLTRQMRRARLKWHKRILRALFRLRTGARAQFIPMEGVDPAKWAAISGHNFTPQTASASAVPI